MKVGRLVLKLSLVLLAVFGVQAQALAYTHNYINSNRSSLDNHVFVTQGVDGEFGSFTGTGDKETVKVDEEGQPAKDYPARQLWKGYGIRTGLGVEVFKFLQFGVTHTFVNLRAQENALERLSGSRVSADGTLSFESPLGNLNLGGGFLASRLDYQKKLENAGFYGSGMFYSFGWNYFMTSQVSVFGVS